MHTQRKAYYPINTSLDPPLQKYLNMVRLDRVVIPIFFLGKLFMMCQLKKIVPNYRLQSTVFNY